MTRFNKISIILVSLLVTLWIVGSVYAVQTGGSGSSNPNRFGDIVNYAEFKSDGELNLYGTARVERHLEVDSGRWQIGLSAPTVNFEGVFRTLDFDPNVDDEVHYAIIVPYTWDSSTDAEIFVVWFYDGEQDNGTVTWGLEYKGVKAGEAVTGAGTTITQTSTGNHTTGQEVRTVFTNDILHENLEIGDDLGLRLYRDTSEDTLGANARLISVHLHLIDNKLGEAL